MHQLVKDAGSAGGVRATHTKTPRGAGLRTAHPYGSAATARPATVEPGADPLLERFSTASSRRTWRARRVAKRAFDLGGSTALLVVLAPVLALLALAVRLTSSGPVFFRQERIGRGGARFRVVKFRTMYPDAEARLHRDEELRALYVENGFTLPPAVDPRVTSIGRFLRRTSLDELPQLWNVVRGQMSLVGPRPVVPPELACYEQWQWAYEAVRPGITGLWQVSGRNAIAYPERARLDATYVADWSLRTDVAILVRTVLAVLRGSEHPEAHVHAVAQVTERAAADAAGATM